MNKNSPNISKYVRKFKYSEQLQPDRDWITLLLCAGLILLLSLALNAWIFIEALSGKNFGAPAAPTTNVFNPSTITNVQNVFKKRATQEDEYQHNYQFVDPSEPGG